MATRKTPAKKAAAAPKPAAESEGAVSALPDGIDRPAQPDSQGAVSAVPDLPGENTET